MDKSGDKDIDTAIDASGEAQVGNKGKAAHAFMYQQKQKIQQKTELIEVPAIEAGEQRISQNLMTESLENKAKEQTRKKKPCSVSYEELFLTRYELSSRQGLHLEKETIVTIKQIVHGIGDERLTVSGFVENVLKHHFTTHESEIDKLFDEKFKKPFQK